MKKFFLVICVLTAALGFSACEEDDNDNLGDTLVGRVWAGDLGFYQNGQYALDSYVYFGSDGFGTDELCFADNGEFLETLRIQWDAYNDGTIRINYGNRAPERELRGTRIRNGALTAELYIAGKYYNRITLYMQ